MLNFNPPLLNSASPWATTKDELQALYDCPYTGALTVRTSLLDGFDHDDTIHQYAFLTDHDILSTSADKSIRNTQNCIGHVSSLNTLGYSPIGLVLYLRMVEQIFRSDEMRVQRMKAFIVSVTGRAEDIVECYNYIRIMKSASGARILLEANLSCPNIAGKPPPAYSKTGLLEYLEALNPELNPTMYDIRTVEVGIKTPPYTHQGQFDDLISALSEATTLGFGCPISFITATNTLGNCLVLDSAQSSMPPVLSSANGTGIGGLAGAALHPLALGNVHTIRRMLDSHENLRHISIIGVGGVSDGAGFRRMRDVGAEAIAVGTAFGCGGISVFQKIHEESSCLK
ncbi:dihydroorotate dehydrogenase [Pseudocyphellaria aurata]|nr:dihydroorotate dehydrogenase [Pseudocyphellaria aurata]